jgi:hypothetical protein
MDLPVENHDAVSAQLSVYQVPNSVCKCAMMHPLGSFFHLAIKNLHPTSSVDKEKSAIAAIVQLP